MRLASTRESARRGTQQKGASVAFIHAVVLGIIQGVAELFPISSAAHTLLL
ncbi:MAG: hypothetical protein JO098_00630, partial [Candidatus Eremiobacteraeota bacterium]|nr:hypothetical protein [Candidatus Eremiobacteraeota bacterium]